MRSLEEEEEEEEEEDGMVYWGLRGREYVRLQFVG